MMSIEARRASALPVREGSGDSIVDAGEGKDLQIH